MKNKYYKSYALRYTLLTTDEISFNNGNIDNSLKYISTVFKQIIENKDNEETCRHLSSAISNTVKALFNFNNYNMIIVEDSIPYMFTFPINAPLDLYVDISEVTGFNFRKDMHAVTLVSTGLLFDKELLYVSGALPPIYDVFVALLLNSIGTIFNPRMVERYTSIFRFNQAFYFSIHKFVDAFNELSMNNFNLDYESDYITNLIASRLTKALSNGEVASVFNRCNLSHNSSKVLTDILGEFGSKVESLPCFDPCSNYYGILNTDHYKVEHSFVKAYGHHYYDLLEEAIKYINNIIKVEHENLDYKNAAFSPLVRLMARPIELVYGIKKYIKHKEDKSDEHDQKYAATMSPVDEEAAMEYYTPLGHEFREIFNPETIGEENTKLFADLFNRDCRDIDHIFNDLDMLYDHKELYSKFVKAFCTEFFS